MIANERPQDAFADEETGTTEGMSDRRWLVDPLCGTLNLVALADPRRQLRRQA